MEDEFFEWYGRIRYLNNLNGKLEVATRSGEVLVGDGVAYALARQAIHNYVGKEKLNAMTWQVNTVAADASMDSIIEEIRMMKEESEIHLAFGQREVAVSAECETGDVS